MSPLDLIRAKDGSMSLTKLAASTFHFNLAVWVSWHTYTKGFDLDAWLLYGGFAVAHATYDKTLAAVNAFKNKKLDSQP